MISAGSLTELEMYQHIALSDYPDEIALCRDVYSDPTQALACAAEYAYYDLNEALPDWHSYIEKVLIEGDGLIFIHYDRDTQL